MNDTLPVTHASTLLGQIERLVKSDIEPERLEHMLALFNRERDRQQLEEFNSAIHGLQEEVYEIATTGANPTFRSAYATLHDLLKYTREVRGKYGITVRFGSTLQKTEPVPPLREGWQRVVLIIGHTSGHWEEHYLDGPPDLDRAGGRGRTPVQTIGSTTTYLRRYLFMMALNIVPGGDPTDDDGERGSLTPLTPEQIEEIKKLITESGMTTDEVSSMLKNIDATTLAEVTARNYARVVNTLINVKRRKEEEVGQN